MRTFLIADELNHLHWKMLKSILMILAILPISHVLLGLLQQTEGSSQIMIGFWGVSVLSASCIIAFVLALQATSWQSDLVQTRVEQWLFKVYRQVPMILFTGLVLFIFQQL